MKPNNIENQIKNHLENREIAPSRNLWDAIEQGNLAIEPTKKKNTYWIGIAASFVLLFSAGWFLLNSKSDEPKIAQKETSKVRTAPQNSVENLTREPAAPIAVQEIESKEKEPAKSLATNKETQTVVKEDATTSPSKITINVDALKKEQEAISKNVLAKTDSAKIKPAVQKKKYTDANALLFSVENKNIIKQTRDGSNVATIELEKK